MTAEVASATAATLAPLPVGYVTLAVAVVGAVFFIGRWMGDVTAFKGAAQETFTSIKNTLSSLDMTLTNLDGDLRAIMRGLPSLTVERGSTLRLTELGRQVSRSVAASALIERVAVDILDDVLEMEPYDIQAFCFDCIRNKLALSVDERNQLKACAFEHGVDLQQVLDVLALELRDMLLEPQQQETGT